MTSMPSSLMTVLSTSKHTASVAFHRSHAMSVPIGVPVVAVENGAAGPLPAAAVLQRAAPPSPAHAAHVAAAAIRGEAASANGATDRARRVVIDDSCLQAAAAVARSMSASCQCAVGWPILWRQRW